MKIIIIANFPSNLDGRRAMGRFTYLGEMLCERGHQVELIVSDFEHGTNTHRSDDSIKREAYRTKITMIHEPGYAKRIGFQRLKSHYVWGKNVGRYLYSIEKPDVVYCAIPSMTVGVEAGKYCEHNKVKYIIDVQDLWPEGFMLSTRNKLLQKIILSTSFYVDKAYKAADVVVGVSETYCNRALSVNKKTRRGVSVYLGNDAVLFDAAKEKEHVDYNDEYLRLAYIGSISYSYDIPCFLKALKKYKDNNCQPKIKFICMGHGPLLNDFDNMAQRLGVDCEFTGALPYEQMVGKMCSCDMLANPIVRRAQQSITNKIGDYALSGLPVINTQWNEEYRRLVEKYNIGINCECENSEEVFEALKRLASDEKLRKEMGANMRKFGVDFFDRRNSYLNIIKVIEQ